MNLGMQIARRVTHSSLISYTVENYEKSRGLNHEVFFRLYRLLLLA